MLRLHRLPEAGDALTRWVRPPRTGAHDVSYAIASDLGLFACPHAPRQSIRGPRGTESNLLLAQKLTVRKTRDMGS